MAISTEQTGSSPTMSAELNLQRKAALAAGGALDHAGRVQVRPMVDFDMGRTIFGGLEGVARTFMRDKLAKEAHWNQAATSQVEADYQAIIATHRVPEIDQSLVEFMVSECDFSMEHADGTFLAHLVFCHDYAAIHYPEQSPNVALLHSIMGTATNTFAMSAAKIGALNALLSDDEAAQVAAFPSILRLLYDHDLIAELEANLHRLDELAGLRMRRVLDNEAIELDAEGFWVNLNFHLMHFVDFMPAANWYTHRNDPLLQMFRTLSELLDRADQRRARVEVSFPGVGRAPVDEQRSVVGRLRGLLPEDLTLKLARKSIRDYSDQIGHDLSFELVWAS